MTMDSKIKGKEALIDYSVNRSHILIAKVHVTLTVRSNWWSARETAEEGNFTIANATRNILCLPGRFVALMRIFLPPNSPTPESSAFYTLPLLPSSCLFSPTSLRFFCQVLSLSLSFLMLPFCLLLNCFLYFYCFYIIDN